jgi:hypothetical protein
MNSATSSLANWTPEQIARAKKWLETWRATMPSLEEIRRHELRTPSGLIEQQYWFTKFACRDLLDEKE